MLGYTIKDWIERDGINFLRDIGLRPGQVVLDFGCNVGHYTIPAAKVIGDDGTVYALDKDKGSLEELKQTAEEEGLKNIVPLHGDLGPGINLKTDSVDVVLLYDVLHYLETGERKMLYREVHRVLKSDGLLSVYPKHNKFDDPLWNLSHVGLNGIIEEIEAENFSLAAKLNRQLIHDNYYNTGYIVNFRKK